MLNLSLLLWSEFLFLVALGGGDDAGHAGVHVHAPGGVLGGVLLLPLLLCAQQYSVVIVGSVAVTAG